MNNHVTSLELSKKLRDIGVPQKSEFYWRALTPDKNVLVRRDVALDYMSDPDLVKFFCSAFLASELLEYLPSIGQRGNLTINKIDTHQYKVSHGRGHWIVAYDLQEALARFLIYLKEKGLA